MIKWPLKPQALLPWLFFPLGFHLWCHLVSLTQLIIARLPLLSIFLHPFYPHASTITSSPHTNYFTKFPLFTETIPTLFSSELVRMSSFKIKPSDNSGNWWWTGRPGLLQFMWSQRVFHDWATELNWTDNPEARLLNSYIPWTKVELQTTIKDSPKVMKDSHRFSK